MLSILKFLNKRHIDSSYIIIYGCFIIAMIYIAGISPVNLLIIVDIYVFVYFTFFKITNKITNTSSNVKIDITQEGVKKEQISLKSLMEDYSNNFSNK